MRRFILACFVAAAGALACSGGSGSGFGTGDDGGGPLGDDGGNHQLGDGSQDGSGPTVSVIYAHTDTELYTMDPGTHAVTDIGPFQLMGGALSGAVTDLAVNANGDVWVNTETDVYRAAVPSSPGPVALTLHTSLNGGGRFYALGFAPAGVLGSGEGLLGGDSNGELWYIDTSMANTTPQDLGGFGQDPNGNTWELSGDVVFYTQNGAPLGLATIRSCGGTGGSGCDKTNDSLAAINMTALTQAFGSKTPANLLKGTYGTGTGVGEIFGLGAWGNSAYGFSRGQSGGVMPELVAIDGTTGAGASLQQFPNITKGWSGAGVTTKAAITVPQPVK